MVWNSVQVEGMIQKASEGGKPGGYINTQLPYIVEFRNQLETEICWF